MARIRSIKPEFPQSETIGALSRDARLLFVLLWTIVDDEGRARAASRMLASLLYPYDDDARGLIDGWLEQLEANNCIRRYTVEGAQYLEIVNWLKHQKIDRPSQSRLPAFAPEFASPREPSRTLDADLGPRTLDMDQDHSSAVADATREPAEKKSRRKAKVAIPEGWSPSESDRAYGAGLNLTETEMTRELERFRNNALSTDRRLSDWSAGYRNWLLKAGEFLQRAPRASPQDVVAPQGFYATATSAELQAWDAWRQSTEGKTYPRDSKGGWTFPSQWPPDQEQAA